MIGPIQSRLVPRGRLIVAALALLGALAGCSTDQRVQARFDRAAGALRDHQPDKAAAIYYEAYELDPEGPTAPDALFRYAHTLEVHVGDPALAAEIYRRLVRLFPDSEQAREGLERAALIELEKLTRPDRALLDYARLIELFPDSPKRPQWALSQAESYVKMGNAAQAEAELSALIRREALPPELGFRARMALGRALMLQDRPAEAARTFERLSERLAADPERRLEWMEARFALAGALAELDETERALSVYREIEGEFPRQEVIQEKINFLSLRLYNRNR